MTSGDVIIFGTKNEDEYQHAVLVVTGTGDDIQCNAHTTDRKHKYWHFWWGAFDVAHFFHFNENAGSSPDLHPLQPSTWDASFVISDQPYNHSSKNTFSEGQPVFIDWAMINENFSYGFYDYYHFPDSVYFKITFLDLGYHEEIQVGEWVLPGMFFMDYTFVDDFTFNIPYNSQGGTWFKLVADSRCYWEDIDENNNMIRDHRKLIFFSRKKVH
jgi:hypothetical protein